ncbi:MAG: TrkH family potassium uptake protein [Methanomicrobiaceae archaeon]|nr:TrkH family potassium uptake protein [Methanomicrobiaceae archaeon]
MDRVGQLAAIADDIGGILRFISLGTCLPLLVAAYYGEWDMFLPMASVPVSLFILGSLLLTVRSQNREARLSTALFAVALIWLICALIGAFPFVFGLGMPYLDSVFEAMSGWTDTGFTMLPSVDDAPHTLLFWRSLMQWLGGLGIVAFTIAMLNRSGITQFRLYRSEGRVEALMPSVVTTGLEMWKIYLILTAAGILLIKLSGVPLWDALNIAMVAIATGGFSVHSAGIPFYENPLLEMLIIPVMIAGALPFKLYFLTYHNRRISLFKDVQARLLFLLILIGFVVVTMDLIFIQGTEVFMAFRQGIFMAAAAVTSTGFQTAQPGEWASVMVIFLLLLMLIGGSSGSTAGGIKLSRIALAFRGLVWWFRRVFVSGRVIVPFRYEGRIIPKNVAELEVGKNMLTIMLFIFIIFIATTVVMHVEPITQDSSIVVFEIVSGMCNNGISTGLVSPDLSPVTKIAFILVMWIGRLEVMPVIVLIIGLLRGFDR